jgi:hypothetical protein
MLAPEIHPVHEEDDFDVSPPYMSNNKKFFTTLPSTLKYKNPVFEHMPTSIKYIYKKTKDRGKKKRKPKEKHHEEEEHGHSWFHDWNPFHHSCEEEEEGSKEYNESGEGESGEEESDDLGYR